MRQCVLRALLWLVMVGGLSGACHAAGKEVALSEYNPSVPFCYLRGGERRWPILSRKLEAGESLMLTARQADQVLGEFTLDKRSCVHAAQYRITGNPSQKAGPRAPGLLRSA